MLRSLVTVLQPDFVFLPSRTPSHLSGATLVGH